MTKATSRSQTGLLVDPGRSKRRKMEREKEKPAKLKRKSVPGERAGLEPPPSLYTTLHFSPTILLSLQDHLKAFSLRHIKQLLLRQLLHDILRILFYVFHEVLYPEKNYIFVLFSILRADKTVICLFILLISKIRLKNLFTHVLAAIKL